MHESRSRDTIRNFRPSFTEIVSGKNVRRVVVQAMTVDRGIRSAGIVPRGFEDTDLLQSESPGGVTFDHVVPPSRVK